MKRGVMGWPVKRIIFNVSFSTISCVDISKKNANRDGTYLTGSQGTAQYRRKFFTLKNRQYLAFSAI